ncbi:4795_t:CDS:1, partial [Funneliformis geosporum]
IKYMAESQNNNQSLINQKETEKVKFRYIEGKIEISNKYKITKPDGTEIEGIKTSTNNYQILEGEGKVDKVLKKLNSLGKTPTLQPKQQTLGENLETKIPEIIQEPQTNQEKFSQAEEKKEVLKTVDANLINNNDGNSGSEGIK